MKGYFIQFPGGGEGLAADAAQVGGTRRVGQLTLHKGMPDSNIGEFPFQTPRWRRDFRSSTCTPLPVLHPPWPTSVDGYLHLLLWLGFSCNHGVPSAPRPPAPRKDAFTDGMFLDGW